MNFTLVYPAGRVSRPKDRYMHVLEMHAKGTCKGWGIPAHATLLQ